MVTTINKSNSTIDIANGVFAVNGNNDLIKAGAGVTLTARGSALRINSTGAGNLIKVGGNGKGATDANDNIVTFSAAGFFVLLDNSRADVLGNNIVATLGSNDAFGIYGCGDKVKVNGINTDVWIGRNGRDAAAANLDSVVFANPGRLTVMGDSAVTASGNGIKATLLGYDRLTLTGSGARVNALGTGDIVTLGGNGKGASDANDHIVTFAAAGVVTLLDNARADVIGNGVDATLGANDAFGLYGSGDRVTVQGTGSDVWIGGNGRTAEIANTVTFAQGGGLTVMGDSRVAATGDGVKATLLGEDWLTFAGLGADINALGTGNKINLGGNGQFASDADTHRVYFAAAGEIVVDSNARVGIWGDGVSVVLGGQDTVAIFGAGCAIDARGAGDEVWIGPNGQGATNSAVNTVAFTPAGGALHLFDDSNVTMSGENVAVTLLAHDTLTASGRGLNITATGAGDVVNISDKAYSDARIDADNTVTFQAGGAANIGAGSAAVVYGSNVTATLEGNGAIFALGGAVKVIANGAVDAVYIGGNGQSATAANVNVVDFSASGLRTSPFSHVTVIDNSNVAVTASYITIILGANDTLDARGSALKITAGGAGDIITVGGNGQDAGYDPYASNFTAQDSVTFLSSVGVVHVLDDSNVIVSGGETTVTLGANDTLYDQTGVAHIFAPALAGADVIHGFDARDTLGLGAHFASVAALISATSFSGGNASIALDATGDSLTLMSVSESLFTTMANSGAITFG